LPPSPTRLNPVVASLLFTLADNIVDQGGVPGCTSAAAFALRKRAEGDLEMALS
jgi:hypothetical protein